MTTVREVVEAPELIVVTVGEQVPRGIDGAAGQDLSITKTASEAMSAYRAVVSDGASGVLLANNTDLTHRNRVVGVTETAAALAAAVNVRRVGQLVFSSWNWVPNAPVFVGVGGVLTQTPPVSPAVFSQIVAVATSPTSIDIELRDPLLIS